MASDSIEHKKKNIAHDLIDKQPIRFDVTFTATFVVAGQVMVTIFGFERFAIGKLLDDFKQFVGIFALLFRKLQIFFELICKSDFVFHDSSAALKSFMLV